MVLAADADAFVHGGGLAFLRRVAPYKKVVGICSTKARLQRLVRIAFASPKVGTGSKGPAAENPTCNALWEALYAASPAEVRFHVIPAGYEPPPGSEHTQGRIPHDAAVVDWDL